MKTVLVTGGTVFVSRYVAEYYVRQGDELYVLNRGTRPQSDGVIHINADRHALGDMLKGQHFDVVIDVAAYNADDIHHLLDALGGFDDYIFISSSSVYPETLSQPFTEEQPIGENRIWGVYGLRKVEAEKALQSRVPHAYILRPPYLYGPMNNVYREAFVFDCAMQDRPFYLPRDGEMPLQFFYIDDLCRFMDVLLTTHPEETVYNVGNPDTVSVKEWVSLCYQAAGKEPSFVNVYNDGNVREYFCFYDYAYTLDVQRQSALMPHTTPLAEGLRKAYERYTAHSEEVNKKPLMAFIDKHLK